jgi:CubicO group peptidase (beta-lactamase class C family)
MFRYYQGILDGGEMDGERIVSSEAVEELTSLQSGDLPTGFTPGNGWGLGWRLIRQPQGVAALLSPGSYGHGRAFAAQGWVDPKRKAIFVLMIQRSGLPNSDAPDIRRRFQQAATDALAGDDSP